MYWFVADPSCAEACFVCWSDVSFALIEPRRLCGGMYVCMYVCMYVHACVSVFLCVHL